MCNVIKGCGFVATRPIFFKDATTIRKISIIIKKCRVHHNNSRSKTLNDEIKITELVYLILQGLCEHNL